MTPALRLAATAAFFASSAAQAVTYTTADIHSGAAPGASFAAVGGSLTIKNAWGTTGVGVTGGRTSDEIDTGEQIVATFSEGVRITGIQLTFLYDGPEFKDVQETARITATFADMSTVSYDLTALYPSSFTWNGLGTVSGPTPNIDANGGFWTLTNPFRDQTVTSLSFTAVNSTCGYGACSNQSDFALHSISTAPIPEPETYALMLAGLGAVGFVARRRSTRG